MRINPVSLMSLILLVILTGVFAVLAVVKTGAAKPYLDNGGDRSRRTNAELAREIADLNGVLAAARRNVAVRRKEIDRLDLQLAALGYAIGEDGRLLTAVATATQPKDPVTGAPLRDSRLRLAAVRVEDASKRLDAQAKDADAPDRKRAEGIQAAVRKRQDELNDTLRRISDQDAAFGRERDELTRKLDEVASAKDKSEKEQRQAYSTRATRIAQLEDRIRELLDMQLRWVKELAADGSVLQAGDGSAIINLGRTDRVAPGMRFAVSTRDQGRQVAKGLVEVVEIGEGTARCRVVEENDPRRLPIGIGDEVASPVYDRQRRPVFCLVGDFKRYNRADLAAFIIGAGGSVAERIGPSCDFLVVGERAERDLAAARQFQAQAMSEDAALRFLQPVFAPKAAQAAGR